MEASTTERAVAVPTAADVRAAAARLAPLLRPSPVAAAPELGPNAFLKLEVAQPTGSFKVRGALNALLRLAPDEPVVAASAGNHGLGIAYAARELGRDATVVVPTTASAAKTRALERFPIALERYGPSYDDAERRALELAGYGMTFVSPYNDPDVVAGQGTIGVELLEQLDGPVCAVCPVGGGGLASGVALALAGTGSEVVGVESERTTPMRAAVAAGRIVPVDVQPTVADGLGGNLEPGAITFGLVRRHVSQLVMVSEDEIARAVRFLAAEHGVVAEGAGAVATAAILAGKVATRLPVVALVTGRNVDLGLLARLLAG